MASIPPEQLKQAIGEVLRTFNHSVTTTVDEAAEECGRIGALMLTQISPRKTGKYASSWDTKRLKHGTVYIYNKKHYRLTHLLEKGHKTNYRTGKYGRKKFVSGKPHIATVEELVKEQFPVIVKNRIESQK